jgi:hypothetical protein
MACQAERLTSSNGKLHLLTCRTSLRLFNAVWRPNGPDKRLLHCSATFTIDVHSALAVEMFREAGMEPGKKNVIVEKLT